MGEDTKYCGHCKREVSSVNFTIHTVHCQRNIAICSMCKEPVPRSHYQQHIETSHKSVPCPKCSQKIEPLKIFAHEKEECPKRMVTCEHCELEVMAAEHDRHKEYCEARTERCKGCTKYVQVRYLQFHYDTDHKYLKPEDKERADENGSDEEGSECPICLGPVTLPLALDCGHVFCMVCVKGIANTTKNCAICRRDITRDMLMDIRFCREEDIIKNYVNKPREKKTIRSHSVPSRGTGPGGRRLVHHTTEDYDEMVSALMSSRTTTPSYRYQRPTNTHTPPAYTPYSTSSSNSESSCQESCKDSSTSESCKDTFQDDDCCCSSNRSNSSTSSTTTTTTATSTTASISCTSITSTTSTTSTQRASRETLSRTSTSSSYSSPPIRSSSAPRAMTSYTSGSTASTSRTSTSSTATSTSSTSTFSSSVSTSSSSVTTPVSSTSSKSSSDMNSSSPCPTDSSSNLTSCASSAAPSSTTTSSYSSSYSHGARPRRPTTLALETTAVLATLAAQTSSSSRLSGTRSAEPPQNATQEQYDRWLAFQLAKADDDLPPAEFNKKHKPIFRRSFSMPERPDNASDSSSSDSDSDSPTSRRSSRRPPASPRSAATSSSSSASSSSRSTPISKSSSDSNASSSSGNGSGSSALSTGARPKSSGLRKRVSFKEDAPPIRREAPVLLPCEFCDDMFPERDLMRHQTSCEHNETQLPRASRLAQLASANSGSTSSVNLVSTSSTSSGTITSVNSTTVTIQSSNTQSSTVSPPPRRRERRMPTPVCAPPRKMSAPTFATERKSTDSPTIASRKSPAPILPRKTAIQSSSQESSTASDPPSCPSSISPPPLSPPPTTTITIVDQPPAVVVSPSLSSGSSRPFSVSPASSTSTNSSSASSGSLSSSSTTPSTSSSASPVPVSMPNPEIAPPDTPTTDIEFEYDEDIPFSRPRKGRLLSSAIFSWRSISGSAATRRGGYARSNTAPLEDTNTDESPQPLQPVTTSHSATQLPSQNRSETDTSSPCPEIPRSPSPSKKPLKQISPPPQNEIIKEQKTKDISPPPTNAPSQEQNETVFIKNPNKYKAPPPPQTPQNSPKPPIKSMSSETHTINEFVNSSPPLKPQFTSSNINEKNQNNTATHKENLIQSDVIKSQTNERNGFLKFDSKPMMNGYAPRETEMLINCEFCKQVFTPEKFRCHQTVCEAALRPVSRRAATPVEQQPPPQKSKSPVPAKHNKGPAPPPPSNESAPADPQPKDPRAKVLSAHKRLERSHSVKDERTSYRVTRRVERASSIKESRASSTTRWGSREVVYSNGTDSPTSYASTGWSGSTSNIYGGGWSSSGSHAWSSHLNMIRDDLRTRAATSSISALAPQDNGGDSDNGGENEVDTEGNGRDRSRSRYNSCNSLLVEVRAALNKTSPSHFAVDTGGARYRERSSSRTRPASMYSMSSGGWGSMYDLSSPSRTFNISDAFSTASLASKRRYIR